MDNGHGTNEFVVPMKNAMIALGIVAIIVIAGMFLLSGSGSANATNAVTGKAVASAGGDVQVIKLSVQNGKYIMDPAIVKKGIPVRIEADIAKMPGCSKSIVISAFNIRKTLNNNDNIIEFVPDKAGTFNIACSMNMYRGTFQVLENDGSKSNYTDPAPTKGASCGAGGGGCGCGGV